eukprot:gene9763-11401_t
MYFQLFCYYLVLAEDDTSSGEVPDFNPEVTYGWVSNTESGSSIAVNSKPFTDLTLSSNNTVLSANFIGVLTGTTLPVSLILHSFAFNGFSGSIPGPSVTSTTEFDRANNYLTVKGSYFLGNSNNASVTVDGDVKSIVSYSPTQMIVGLGSSRIGGVRNVKVQFPSLPALSPFVSIVSIAPQITEVTKPITGSDRVTVTGTYVNSKGTTVWIQSTQCQQPQILSDTQISCNSTGMSDGKLFLRAHGDVPSNQVDFKMCKPTLNSYSLNDNTMTLNGICITRGYVNFSSTVYSVKEIHGTTLSFDLVEGHSTMPPNGYIELGDGSLSISNRLPILFVPIVSSIGTCQTSGGPIAFDGKWLYTRDAFQVQQSIKILVGGMECIPNMTLNNFNQIICNMPSTGQGASLPVSLSIADKPAINLPSFTYVSPVISSHSQSGGSFMLRGTSFGSRPNETSITYNTNVTLPFVLTNHIGATFDLPVTLESMSIMLTLSVSGQSVNYPLLIAPHVSSITPNGLPTTGGEVVINGRYFTNIPSVYIGKLNTADNSLKCTMINSTRITCQHPGGSGRLNDVEVINRGQSSRLTGPIIRLVFSPPSITTATNTDENGGLVSIRGSNFFDKGLSVKIGEMNCTSPILLETWLLVCQLGQWYRDMEDIPQDLVNVIVRVDQQEASAKIFYYNLEAYNSRMRDRDAETSRLKWLIPSIIALIIVFAVIAFVLIKFRSIRIFTARSKINLKSRIDAYSAPSTQPAARMFVEASTWHSTSSIKPPVSNTADIEEEEETSSADGSDDERMMPIDEMPREVKSFFRMPEAPYSVPVLDWWMVHQATFPTIAKIASDYLGAQYSWRRL